MQSIISICGGKKMYEVVVTWVGRSKFHIHTIETYFLRKDSPNSDFYTIYLGIPFCNCKGYKKAVFYSKIRLRCVRKRIFNMYKDVKQTHTLFSQEIDFVLKDMKIQNV